MSRSFDAKLLALGEAGRRRLTRAWADVDTTTNRICSAFSLQPPDIAKLKQLLGPRPVAPKLKRCSPQLARWA